MLLVTKVLDILVEMITSALSQMFLVLLLVFLLIFDPAQLLVQHFLLLVVGETRLGMVVVPKSRRVKT